jgi:cytochrome c oxidase subunit 4
MSHSHDDVKSHVKTYMMVFGALMFLTIVTVAVSYVHLAVPLAITVALIIAIVKGSLVASVFMHLSNEKKLIYSSLLLTVVFFVVLLAVPILTTSDGLHYPDASRSATAGTSGVLKPHAKPAGETKPH